ncbi:TetR/AcrR family transcriptional regulator [Rhodobacteraceae bacterium RKSG542]|uniref:TetR/AcrR family transcriptional regulator n=1 Tax=Pseudovibrio flavus TaxID=2529854 RepID=UPI0012BCC4A3|nr:TetR/AcrR family transcriptional regulator [Pseudovibrio flavus]MTI17102.1 TetR/AcrR family transcriptional regulator [Pseudovibrio flavus]
MVAPSMRRERRDRQQRKQQIIDVSRKLFLSHGFEKTSIKMIIDEVGGSRRDVYDLFGGKEDLFEAVMQDLIENVKEAGALESLANPSSDIFKDLYNLAYGLLNKLLEASSITIMRQFVTIAETHRELGIRAYNSGPASINRALEVYFEARTKDGTLELEDIPSAARMFFDMVRGDFQLRMLLTGIDRFEDEELSRHVSRAVRLFLKGAESRA